jgi:hypothetical protein
MGFWGKLSALFTSFQRGALKNVLSGAGVMLTTSALFMTALSTAMYNLQNSVSGISGDIAGLLHLSGFDTFISIILAAVVTRMTLNQGKLSLKKMQ